MSSLQSIKTKILFTAIALSTLPVIISSFMISHQASSAAGDALSEQTRHQLISIREIKKGQLQNYFSLMERRIKSYAGDPAIGMYLQRFNTALGTDRRNLADVNTQKSALSKYYQEELTKQYSAKNSGASLLNDNALTQLDNIGIVMQHSYIAANSEPFGKKSAQNSANDGTTYSGIHSDAHKVLRAIYEKTGASDLYLIDNNGTIMYSVEKYPDFGSNLKSGPFKDSPLGQLWQDAAKAADSDKVFVSDIKPYTAAMNAPAMFMMILVQDRSTDDAYELLGSLALRIPLEQIDAVMTSDNKWADVGMGKTGDVYLIGKDKTLRSNIRPLLENTQEFTDRAQQLAQQPSLADVQRHRNGVARLAHDNDAINNALAGQTGVISTFNLFNDEVFSAYTPFKFGSLNWAIVSEINTHEALAAQDDLTNKVRWTSIILMLIIAGAAVVIGTIFATQLTRPVIRLSKFIQQVEHDSDLTQRIDITSKDEIGTMAIAINNMLEKFRASMEQVSASTTMLATASEEMSSITDQTGKSVMQQFHEIDQIATAINQMTATVQEVARNADEAALAAETANQQSTQGHNVVNHAVQSITGLYDEIGRTSDAIDQLSNESQKIGSVIDVIKSVAEQTNLLALNAAIEAARAGEQGRGFAVVADEVRTLASRTQQSTGEIESMINSLQSGAKHAVSVMQQSRDKSQEVVKYAEAAGESLTTISRSVNNINDMNLTIANAAKEQSTVTDEINKNIVTIRRAAEETTNGASQTTNASNELSKLAAELQQLVAQFKTG